jgi:von Willebrand factor type A domain-containing protein
MARLPGQLPSVGFGEGPLMDASGLLLAATTARRTFEFGRIQSDLDWIVLLGAFGLILVYVVFLYRRDAVELGRGTGTLLVALRILAFAGLAVVYLQPQWRNERQVVHNSRLLVLVDTSLSMNTDDNDASPAEPNRAQQIMALLAENKFLNELRRVHDVVVLRFDTDLGRIVTLNRTGPETPPKGAAGKPRPGDRPVDWQQALEPHGTETRLGQALRDVIVDEQAAPVSAIVVLTDGQQNAGLEPSLAADLARETNIPIYPIGIGSARQPANVRISDFSAPTRAYPGDHYTVKGYLQAQGLAGKTVTVELLSRPGGSGKTDGQPPRLEGSEQVTLGGDGEATQVSFSLTPGQVGRRTLTLRIKAPPEDRNPDDNQREAAVQVVDRKNRVLLFAGGPSREYQFLRNQLRRDKEVVVDVLLQSGAEGISQDSHAILDDFPSSRAEMFPYDCVVAFDPDWRKLSAHQVDLVAEWVDKQAGGLIVIPGPVYTDAWSQSPALSKIRDLYPVEFNRRFSVAEDAHFGSQEPWPLSFTREGLDAPFLWLADTAAASAADWSEFKGVYGYYAVRGPKLGATVYAHYSDPRAATGNELPIYFAGQTFGSGQVFYLSSGEMWRLRAQNESWFDTFYTKLIRHVSQHRLLRGSSRGVLFTERDQYLPGNTVDVAAQLTNAQLAPLELPQVDLQVVLPDGTLQTIALKADPKHAGNYRGQFTVRKEGSYRLELPVPESKDEPLTTPPIQVTIPNLERDHVERNDALLAELARRTGGQYYVGLESALGHKPGVEPLAGRLRDQSRVMTLAAAPEPFWTDATPWHRSRWILGAICGVLCLEWLVRRLARLA